MRARTGTTTFFLPTAMVRTPLHSPAGVFLSMVTRTRLAASPLRAISAETYELLEDTLEIWNFSPLLFRRITSRTAPSPSGTL